MKGGELDDVTIAEDLDQVEDEDDEATIAPRPRRRRRRNRPRAKTVPIKKITKEELRIGASLYPVVDLERPRTRGDCNAGGCNEQRPCPWIACVYHLYLDVNPSTGSLKINFPDLEPWELPPDRSCALDVADRGGITLEESGEILNLTRERIWQVEVRGLIKIKMASPSPDELGARILEVEDAVDAA